MLKEIILPMIMRKTALMRLMAIITMGIALVGCFGCLQAQTDETVFYAVDDAMRHGPLVSSATAMETAWDLVRNPLDSLIIGSPESAELIRRGFRIFIQTPAYAPGFSGNGMACGHCHLNAGQRELALPLVGVATAFPEYNKRAGRTFSLTDRIVGCFMRSMNAVGAPALMSAHEPAEIAGTLAGSEEVRALEAYVTWLSEGFNRGDSLPWRRMNKIASDNIVPLASLDSARGDSLFTEHCANCHGDDGQGVEIGDIKAGPLWGPGSWNDGAGAARIYTLAGIIRYMMPYVSPGALTDEEAQHISFFINSHDRPVYPFKADDYLTEKMPVDALYYLPKK